MPRPPIIRPNLLRPVRLEAEKASAREPVIKLGAPVIRPPRPEPFIPRAP
jgi:hypothetical protein